jgi:hypothetical protein
MFGRYHPLARERVVALAERGFAASVALNGKHYKGRWLQDGRSRLLAISRSASHHNAAVHSRATLQRLLRETDVRP